MTCSSTGLDLVYFSFSSLLTAVILFLVRSQIFGTNVGNTATFFFDAGETLTVNILGETTSGTAIADPVGACDFRSARDWFVTTAAGWYCDDTGGNRHFQENRLISYFQYALLLF